MASESTFYQLCPDCNGNGFIEHMAANPTLDETVEDCTRCVQWQGMVPVERCEHGKIDGHWIVRLDKMEDDWCPGAGIGGDDE